VLRSYPARAALTAFHPMISAGNTQRGASVIATHCISHRSALHRPTHRTAPREATAERDFRNTTNDNGEHAERKRRREPFGWQNVFPSS